MRIGNVRARARLLVLLAPLALVGCTGVGFGYGGNGGVIMYQGSGFYDPFYYGGGGYYRPPPISPRPPPVRPMHPIERPSRPMPMPMPMPLPARRR
jgi:hypothetical protein